MIDVKKANKIMRPEKTFKKLILDASEKLSMTRNLTRSVEISTNDQFFLRLGLSSDTWDSWEIKN